MAWRSLLPPDGFDLVAVHRPAHILLYGPHHHSGGVFTAKSLCDEDDDDDEFVPDSLGREREPVISLDPSTRGPH